MRWRVGEMCVGEVACWCDCSHLLTCLVETSSPLQNKLGEMSVGEMRVCEVWCWQNEGVDEKGRMWVLVKCGRN